MGLIQRTALEKVNPTVYIKDEGDDHFTLKTFSALKTTKVYFKLGVPFDENTADGRKAKVNLRLCKMSIALLVIAS